MIVKREGKGFENGGLRGGKKKDQDQTRQTPEQTRQTGPNPSQQAGLGQQDPSA